MTQAEWLAGAARRLADSGCPDPEVDAEWLLEYALDTDRRALRRQRGAAIEPAAAARLEALLERRCAGEPVQYITNTAWFYGNALYVDPRVLIPRADTENLVEAAARFLADSARRRPEAPPRCLDLCAGSGAIGLTLARLCPAARVTLADLSPEALAVARSNAKRLGVAAEFLHGDLFVPVSDRRFELIACNPPYIPRGELSALQREVRREPALALDGGADGLDFYRRIAGAADARLAPGGRVYLEVGAGQAQSVLALMLAALPAAASGVIDDLQGIPRVVWCEKAAD